MRLFFIIVSILLFTISNAQNRPFETTTFEIEDLQEDFNFWRKRLENKHPLLYLYRSKEEIDNLLDSAYQAINRPMTELEFFRLLSGITAKIQDGHNLINFSVATIDKIVTSSELFPLEVRWLNQELLVSYNLSSNPTLKVGTAIKSINGVSTEKITQTILDILPSDGNAKLDEMIMEEYFRFYYLTCFGVNATYELTCQSEEKTFTIDIEGEHIDTLRKRNTAPKINYCIEFIEQKDKVAILKIPTFDKDFLKTECDDKFKNEVRDVFKTIKTSNTEHLIIDLRNNNGGNPEYVAFILKHLMPEPFQQNVECRIVHRPEEADFLKRTKKKWYPFYGLGTIRPKKEIYEGKIYVLINKGTFSAGVDMALVLKKYNRATFIGQPTGGNPIIMGGYLIKTTWKLPNTKIRVSPATLCTKTDTLNKNTGQGIQPDYPIEAHFEKDNSLKFVLELISKKNE